MAHHFTDEEAGEWLEQQPKKPLSAKIALYNPKSELLIVKPNYKPGWHFVGGMIDDHESPLQACLRETQEEIGVELQPVQLHFLGVRYGVSKTRGDEYLHFLFTATLTSEQAIEVRLQDSELEDMKWVPGDTASNEILDHTYKLLLRVRKHPGAAYYAEQDDAFVPSPGTDAK
jgi:8-oxo-dGTP pyrophosphatase MutT (NUDIX family)